MIFLASLTSAETLLYLALKCVSASLFTCAFFASSAASTEVECFLSAALSASRAAKVESKIRRSTPEKKRARRRRGPRVAGIADSPPLPPGP